MTVTSALARPMLAGIFIYGGLDAVRHPETKVPQAEAVAPAIAEHLGLSTDTLQLVKLNGAVQVAGGALLVIGKFPRLASLALVGSLVPTTYAGHRFWEETDDLTRSRQQIQFLKNVAMLGGLLLAAGDTGGRPSLTWRARRATRRASKASKIAAVATHGASKMAIAATQGAAKTATAATHVATKTATAATQEAARTATAATQEAARTATAAAHDAARTARAATHGASKTAASATHGAGKRAQAASAGAAAGATKMSRRAAKAGRRASRATREAAIDLAHDTADLARDTAAKAREALPTS